MGVSLVIHFEQSSHRGNIGRIDPLAQLSRKFATYQERVGDVSRLYYDILTRGMQAKQTEISSIL